MTGHQRLYCFERALAALHHIVSAAAVDVDVNESRRDHRVTKVLQLGPWRQRYGLLSTHAFDLSVVDNDNSIAQGFLRGEHNGGSEGGRHSSILKRAVDCKGIYRRLSIPL
jgi:hypothetical protein